MIRCICITVIIVATLGVDARAGLISYTGTLSGTFTATPALPPDFQSSAVFTGTGFDTLGGAFVISGSNNAQYISTFDVQIYGGLFTRVYGGGDTIFGTYTGTSVVNSAHDQASVTQDVVITGGTGIFAGIEGSQAQACTAQTIGMNPDGTLNVAFSGSYTGTVTITPELSTLLTSSIVFSLFTFIRLRWRSRPVR
jgi:hypothetical protein